MHEGNLVRGCGVRSHAERLGQGAAARGHLEQSSSKQGSVGVEGPVGGASLMAWWAVADGGRSCRRRHDAAPRGGVGGNLDGKYTLQSSNSP